MSQCSGVQQATPDLIDADIANDLELAGGVHLVDVPRVAGVIE
ncbi:MAG: hypothetical protein NZM29_01785 [Nitrospira sp.]|nr:hypothetical protein [Nitrospira sp.]